VPQGGITGFFSEQKNQILEKINQKKKKEKREDKNWKRDFCPCHADKINAYLWHQSCKYLADVIRIDFK